MKTPEGYDEDAALDAAISSKMSKSVPESGIFVHDTKQTIAEKIKNAYCPPKVIENNPDQVATYKGGKTTIIGWFVGQVMKQSRGKADPQLTRSILEELLSD